MRSYYTACLDGDPEHIVMKVVVGAQLRDLFIANEFITIKAIHE